jgi:hypothetical protein
MLLHLPAKTLFAAMGSCINHVWISHFSHDRSGFHVEEAWQCRAVSCWGGVWESVDGAGRSAGWVWIRGRFLVWRAVRAVVWGEGMVVVAAVRDEVGIKLIRSIMGWVKKDGSMPSSLLNIV